MKNIDNDKVVSHYGSGELIEAIRDGIAALGKSTGSVTIDDLAPVDEFHIGGRSASRALIDQMGLMADDLVLDIGCGLGGTSRFIANNYDCVVRGIDLTPEFISAGNEICKWLKLDDVIRLQKGNALNTGFDDDEFDAACMLHVGMNIAEKTSLFAEIARVVRPGGCLAVYDIMKRDDQPLQYPVPWASDSQGCALASQSQYRDAMLAAGFEILKSRDRTEIAIDFFAKMKNSAASESGPPPIGLHLVMGADAAAKVGNMIDNVVSGRIAPIEIIARKL